MFVINDKASGHHRQKHGKMNKKGIRNGQTASDRPQVQKLKSNVVMRIATIVSEKIKHPPRSLADLSRVRVRARVSVCGGL